MAFGGLAAYAIGILLCCVAINAQADTWTSESGTAIIITASFDANYPLRIYVRRSGIEPLANCAGKFAYISNVSSKNFQAKTALLLNSYNQKQPITFTYTLESNGYCRIGDISLISQTG